MNKMAELVQQLTKIEKNPNTIINIFDVCCARCDESGDKLL